MRYAASLRHVVFALAILAAFVFQETWALAGTTGALSGNVRDASGAPVAGASVTASSSSQTATTTTDGTGHFSFVSLAPDTYTVAVSKEGYDNISQSGISVFADQQVTTTITQPKTLRVIANVRSSAAGALVKPGTTADVYSINTAMAERAAVLGGGGSLNQAYGAVASVPGVYLPTGASGWNQTVLIRGGDYPQVGYEYDGVPVNRSFDNYPAHTASALGQQEIEVYTGSSPANAESTGLAGFINQVIRTGTFPGFGTLDAGVGTPVYYHKFSAEAGGATPNRLFSYYVGIAGFNQDQRVVNQYNNVGYSQYGVPLGVVPCTTPGNPNFVSCYAASGAFGNFGFVGPGGYVQGPYNAGTFPAYLSDRENVVNLHFGIPHKNGRDDVQLLYSDSSLLTTLYDSASDWAIPGLTQFLNPPSSWEYHGAMGSALPSPAMVASQITPYYFPTLNANAPNNFIPSNRRGGYWNDAAIVKAQYQKNFGSNAFIRLYGYTFYSDWLNTDPNSESVSNPFFQGLVPEYELSTHTRGASLTFADQLGAQNLLNVQASTVRSTVNRFNNSSYTTAGRAFGFVVNSATPSNGVCYQVTGLGAATPVDCTNTVATAVHLPGFAGSAFNPPSGASPTDPLFTAQFPNLTGTTCSGSPCELLGAETGLNGTLNQVTPTFNAYSATDQFRPTDKIVLNGGLRYETYQFDGVDTNTGARPFWFASWNNSHCVNTAPGSTPFTVHFTGTTAATCPAGTVPALLTNGSANYFYHVLEPRIAGTFTINPLNVIRFSYGRYSQPANTASEQYNEAQQNLPGFLGPIFYGFGFTSPGHNVPPEVSNNYDLSWEHQVKGTSMSWKITPFWRATNGEQTAFFINPVQAFVSNIPVGNLTSKGVEFAFTDGDFARNGFAGQLAFTYAYTTIKYGPLNNGATPLSVINNDVATYNAFTSTCAAHPTDSRCVLPNGSTPLDPTTGTPIVASPCYTTTGAPAPCGPTTIANPYWNAPAQGLFNLNGPYFPTDTVVATTALNVNSYMIPYVATVILNYKWNHLAITPSFQFEAGQRYGVPETTEGIDPAAGCAPLGPLAPNDPRYVGGTAGLTGANAYNATTCASGLRAIPNTFTGKFDGIGDFSAPSQFLANMQISYDISPKITLQLTMANIINTCFGGTKAPWTTGTGTPHVCSYTSPFANSGFVGNTVGNFYNPGTPIQQQWAYPYLPFFGVYNPNVTGGGNQPFNLFIDARVKL